MRNRNLLARVVFVVLLTTAYVFAGAQSPTDSLPGDPGAVTIAVTKVQDLNFGAFSVGAGGGTITISNTGLRTATGGITMLNLGLGYFQALFDIEAPENTIISVTNGPDAVLTGSNGGTMTLKLGTCSPGPVFTTTVSPPARTSLSIGGTLTITSAANSPPGPYTGSFEIYIDYQ